MQSSPHRARWRAWPIAAILLLLLVPTLPAAASPNLPIAPQLIEGTTTIIYIDSPTPNTAVRNGETIKLQGWAVDTAGPGVGIAEIHVYLDGQAGQGGTGIGAATSVVRSDVASAHGRSDWANAGFELSWTATGLTPGNHTIYVYARSNSGGWQYRTLVINVTGPAPMPTPGPGMGMPPYGQPGPGGLPYGVTPPANQLGGSDYGSGYPFGDLYGPAGRPCGPASPGQWGDSPLNPFDDTYCPPPPPPPFGYYPPGPPPPVFPGGGAPVIPVAATSAGTVGLSWPGVPNASEYRIYQTNNAFSQTFTHVTTITQTLGAFNTSTTITGLTPGQTYFFQVRAIVNGAEQVIPANGTTTGGTIGGPPPPGNLQVSARTSNSVTLTWIPVPGVNTYRVSQAVGTSTIFGGAVTTGLGPNGATVSGLLPNTQYTFRVTGIDAFGMESTAATVQTTTTS